MMNFHKSAENKFNIISQRKMLDKRHTHAIFKEINLFNSRYQTIVCYTLNVNHS